MSLVPNKARKVKTTDLKKKQIRPDWDVSTYNYNTCINTCLSTVFMGVVNTDRVVPQLQ